MSTGRPMQRNRTWHNERRPVQRGVCKFFRRGYCMHGDSCRYLHELAPAKQTDRSQPKQGTSQYNRSHGEGSKVAAASSSRGFSAKNNKHSRKIEKSKDLCCGICMDVVYEKSEENQRKFGLMENCDHIFCIDCILRWRKTKKRIKETVLSCPMCRVSSVVVVPNRWWVDDKAEKTEIFQRYKQHLGSQPCRYFREGRGRCNIGAECPYKHAYPDGTLQDRSEIEKDSLDSELLELQMAMLYEDYFDPFNDSFDDLDISFDDDPLAGVFHNFERFHLHHFDSDDESDFYGYYDDDDDDDYLFIP